jgi:hypothetical protein
MPVSEKKKASNAKWDRANMVVLSCKVRKEKADAFKAYAAQQGKTGNTLLKEYVMQCIGEDSGQSAAGEVLE